MINSLNNKQIDMISKYVSTWIQNGLTTKYFSKKEAIPIIHGLYQKVLNKPIPEEILIFPSPLSLWKHIQSIVGNNISFISPYLCGSFDAHLFAYYDYYIDVLKIKIPDNIILERYNCWKQTHRLGPIYPFDDICLVSQHPEKYFMKNNILHNENGPAIKYSDGFEIYALNGVIMKKEYVMTPWNKLDVIKSLKEPNAEIRRELVKKIGIERIIKEVGAKILDKQDDYELIEFEFDNRKRPYLKMINPSIGVYHIEGVPPGTKTVAEALRFRNGTDEIPKVLT